MIYEALSTLKDPNGSDISAMVSFIEKRHEVPPNFRRQLSARLKRLVSQEKLEKAQNGYRLRREVVNGTKGPIPNPKEIRPRLSGASSEFATGDTVFSSVMMLTTRTMVLHRSSTGLSLAKNVKVISVTGHMSVVRLEEVSKQFTF
ncbi:putative linker histone H1/H5, domain H15, winged helix-like DNA-binding domain superfamily [Helianthus annuus]|nr:putative linker histone H1/H5, domain H15, winged helix-like DNA-binding domain superfamily [Helianthus annuus]